MASDPLEIVSLHFAQSARPGEHPQPVVRVRLRDETQYEFVSSRRGGQSRRGARSVLGFARHFSLGADSHMVLLALALARKGTLPHSILGPDQSLAWPAIHRLPCWMDRRSPLGTPDSIRRTIAKWLNTKTIRNAEDHNFASVLICYPHSLLSGPLLLSPVLGDAEIDVGEASPSVLDAILDTFADVPLRGAPTRNTTHGRPGSDANERAASRPPAATSDGVDLDPALIAQAAARSVAWTSDAPPILKSPRSPWWERFVAREIPDEPADDGYEVAYHGARFVSRALGGIIERLLVHEFLRVSRLASCLSLTEEKREMAVCLDLERVVRAVPIFEVWEDVLDSAYQKIHPQIRAMALIGAGASASSPDERSRLRLITAACLPEGSSGTLAECIAVALICIAYARDGLVCEDAREAQAAFPPAMARLSRTKQAVLVRRLRLAISSDMIQAERGVDFIDSSSWVKGRDLRDRAYADWAFGHVLAQSDPDELPEGTNPWTGMDTKRNFDRAAPVLDMCLDAIQDVSEVRGVWPKWDWFREVAVGVPRAGNGWLAQAGLVWIANLILFPHRSGP